MKEIWKKRFLALARTYSSWSKDPSTKVGAVIVGEDKEVISTGYNGFPRGVIDSQERLEHRETKYQYIVHAEQNAIFNASLTGSKLKGSSLFVWGLPICNECAKGIIQTGIKKVYIHKSAFEKNPVWNERWGMTAKMFLEAGVEIEIVEGEMNDEF